MTRRIRLALLFGLLVSLLAVALPSANAQLNTDPFTVVVIPDTQIYVQSDAGTEVFRDQFQWVVDHLASRRIAFLTHEGDVSQNPASITEWDRIESVFAVLEAADVPYGIAAGNHDIDADGTAPEYDARFGADRFAGKVWYGGNHEAEGNRSSYQTVSVPGHDLLFVHVRHLVEQFGPVQPVLNWVEDVLAAHPDHLVFVTTHEFTDSDGSVLAPGLQTVIQANCNVAFVFSGHRTGGAGRGTFDDSCGRTVHHLLTNYQQLSGGGQGFLRTVEVDPLTLDVSTQVYSPTLDEYRTGENEEFSAALTPLIAVLGDADCDRELSLGDAIIVAQYSVGLRQAQTSCPLADPATVINGAVIDVNADDVIDVADAILIAQCTVGLLNQLCP